MLSDYSYLEEIGHEKGDLIKGLQLIQQKEGYVSDEAVKAVAANFNMAEAEVEGVLTFYAQFKRVKPGRFQISSCDGTALLTHHVSQPICRSFRYLSLT